MRWEHKVMCAKDTTLEEVLTRVDPCWELIIVTYDQCGQYTLFFKRENNEPELA